MTVTPDHEAGAPAPSLRQLLDDHVRLARRPGNLSATALRTASRPARILLAHAATGGRGTLDDLMIATRARATARLLDLVSDPDALADLARVIGLQAELTDDQADALALYDVRLELFGLDSRREHQATHAQLALAGGRPDLAERLCATSPAIPIDARNHLNLDLVNPFTSQQGDAAVWFRRLGELFAHPPIGLRDGPEVTPFDRLTTAPMDKVHSESRVSVIVPCYRPGPGLLTAVQSIFNQSWANVEVIVVDDASPPEHADVLAACEGLDARITILRMPVNRGTYVARNAGLDAATGEFVTFQDCDDWSHPARLAAQVFPLVEDDTLVATTTDGLMVTEDLLASQPGRFPQRLNTSSLLFRRQLVLDRIGYFDEVRKSADTEYLLRIEAVFGKAARSHVGGALYSLIRVATTSLSGGDFRAGWTNPTRLAYRSAYRLWHRRIQAGEADPYRPRAPASRAFPAPAQLRPDYPTNPDGGSYDLIVASDWRPDAASLQSMIEEVGSLVRRGHRVAVLHLEAYRFRAGPRQLLADPIQELVNAGTVGHVVSTDNVVTSLLIIRNPSVLQFAARTRAGIRAGSVIVQVDRPPVETDGGVLGYLPGDCHDAARDIFGMDPLWSPQGVAVRAALAPLLRADQLTPFDMPVTVDTDLWIRPRTGFRSNIPVIGRHCSDNGRGDNGRGDNGSGDHRDRWPADGATLLAAYPDSTDVDVRILGGLTAVTGIVGAENIPRTWLSYGPDEVTARGFTFQLDFWVYYMHPVRVEAFDRAILEAMASGCVVILPDVFRPAFGDGALYREPANVLPTIRAYYADKAKFLEQSQRGQRCVRERYGHESYARLISTIMARTADDTGPGGHADVGAAGATRHGE